MQLIQDEDLLQDNSDQLIQDKRAKLADYIDRHIMVKPRGPERWRAAKSMAIELNFSGTPGLDAREENRLVEADNARDRFHNHVHNKGYDKSGDKNSDFRGALNMPVGVNMLIKMVDPEAFDKQNIQKLLKAFPEYRISEKF